MGVINNGSIHYANQSPNNGLAEDEIDLGRLLRILAANWRKILGFGFTLTIIAGIVVFSMQPVYEGKASIVLETDDVNIVSVEDIYSLGARNSDYMATQFEILKSHRLAERVVDRLNLTTHPVFAGMHQQQSGLQRFKNEVSRFFRGLFGGAEPEPQLSDQEQLELLRQRIADNIQTNVEVSPIRNSQMSYVAFESIDPQLAAQVANAVADEFIKNDLENRLSGTLQATDWLDERLIELRTNLQRAELALQDFRDREGLVSIDGQTGLGVNELASLSQRLEEARKARIAAENLLADVQNLATAEVEQLLTIPAVLNHVAIQRLSAEQSKAQRQVDELQKRYGPKHPAMVAALSELNSTTAELNQEVTTVASGIGREYEFAKRTEQQLEATWEKRKSEVQEFNRKEFQLLELQRDVDTNRQLYDIFFTRIRSVSETGGFEKPHARIVDLAKPPRVPVKPKKQLILVLAMFLGLMLGAAFVLILEQLDNTIRHPDDVADKLSAPLLGSLPLLKLDEDDKDIPHFWINSTGNFAESIRTVRTGLRLSSLDSPAKVVVVTSTLSGEGKSTLSLNLSAALGQMEKTLLIGADLRRPTLASRLDLAPSHKGLSHFVAGSAELDDCIEHLEDKGFWVMPSGIIPPNPLEMLSSARFTEALAELRKQFDRIVIDSAPMQPVSDAMVLSTYADALIYLVRADKTPATLVRKSLQSLSDANINLTGVVLNHFDASRAHRYYSYGYNGYGYKSGYYAANHDYAADSPYPAKADGAGADHPYPSKFDKA